MLKGLTNVNLDEENLLVTSFTPVTSYVSLPKSIIKLMKSVFKIFLLSILCTNVVFSQILKIDRDLNTISLPQGFTLESLCGFGYSNTTKLSISNISSGNPASLWDFQKLSLGFSMQFDSEIKDAWIAQTGHKRSNNNLPQSFGASLPVWKFKIGYGFNQKYNSEMISEKIELSTVTHPDGTGEYFIPTRKTYVTTNSIIASFALQNDQTVLLFGAEYSQNKLDFYQKVFNSIISHNDYSDSWSIGFRYDNPSKYQIGFFFEKGVAFKKLNQVSYSIDQDSLYEFLGDIHENFFVVGYLPDEIHFGTTYKISHEIQLVGNFTYIYWNHVSDSYKDEIDYSSSIVHRLNSRATISAGFHYIDGSHNEGNGFYDVEMLKAIYVTSGLILNFRTIEIEVSLADSHLFSGDWRKQTIGKFGFGIYL